RPAGHVKVFRKTLSTARFRLTIGVLRNTILTPLLKPFNSEVFMAFRACIFATRVLLVVFAGILASAQSAFVRVNQLGYVSGGVRRAYLMASAAEPAATFVIKNSGGTTVFGPVAIGANLGSWSGNYANVYALDFNNLVTAGTYTIAVNGPIAANSPSFKIDTAANVYAGALSNALSFY